MSTADDMFRAEAKERMQMAHDLRVTFRSDEFKIKPWELRMLEDAYMEMLVERPCTTALYPDDARPGTTDG